MRYDLEPGNTMKKRFYSVGLVVSLIGFSCTSPSIRQDKKSDRIPSSAMPVPDQALAWGPDVCVSIKNSNATFFKRNLGKLHPLYGPRPVTQITTYDGKLKIASDDEKLTFIIIDMRSPNPSLGFHSYESNYLEVNTETEGMLGFKDVDHVETCPIP